MRVLILGGTGMLGHRLWQVCAQRFETFASVRRTPSDYRYLEIFDEARLIGQVLAEDFAGVERAIESVNPDAVVNCIGIVKQDESAKNPIASITVNSLFPHRVAQAVLNTGGRLIHLSTDCVFSGRRGYYSETDVADAEDLYGRSKLLGEVLGERCLTLRTSMIGRELHGSHGLLEWFLSQSGVVQGFRRAVFSGFTTAALARLIADVIDRHPQLNGLWHVAAEPITKFDLLTLVKQTYGLATKIEPDDTFVCDRSLNGTRFRETTGIQPPSWTEMIEELRADPTPYEEIRKQ
jgi:dTDP-4-dehydrorhamnose reductase